MNNTNNSKNMAVINFPSEFIRLFAIYIIKYRRRSCWFLWQFAYNWIYPKKLHTSTNALILNLTLSDFLLSTLIENFTIVGYWLDKDFSKLIMTKYSVKI